MVWVAVYNNNMTDGVKKLPPTQHHVIYLILQICQCNFINIYKN